MSRNRLFSNIFSLYFLQGLNYLIPMAVLPYLVRVLGIDRYGLLAFAQSFALYFNILTDYGFNYSATRYFAQNQKDQNAVGRMFSCVLLIKLMLMLLGAIILLFVITCFSRFRHDAAFFLVAYLAVVGNTLFPVWFFQGIQQMRYISIATGSAKLLSAALLFVFVHDRGDALLALTIQSAGMLIAGLIGLFIALQKVHFQLHWPRAMEIRNTLADGWHLFISTAGVSLYSNTNVFLVGVLAGNVQAGYFAVAEKLIRAMAGMVAPVSQAMFPHVSSLASTSFDDAWRFTYRALKWLAALTMAMSLLLLIFANPIAWLCFGSRAIGCVPIIRWIALLPFLITMNTTLGVQTMVTFGLDKQFSRIMISGGIVNALMAIPLILMFAAQGAGACVLITETSIVIVMLIVLHRHGISFSGNPVAIRTVADQGEISG